MEIAHTQTGILRLIGKAVLVGLVVILLAKTILTLLALAVVGLIAYFCARTVYIRRGYLKRTLLWTGEMLIRSVTAVLQAGTAILVAAISWVFVCASWVLLRLSQFTWTSAKKNLPRLSTGVCVLLGRTARLSCIIIWQCLRQSQEVLTSALGVFFCYLCKIAGALAQILVRGCVGVIRVGAAAWVNTRRQSNVICGTLVEAASGALVGAMLLNLKGIEGLVLLPEVDLVGARVCAAALFGAFLGITVGLSRNRWAKESETGLFPENLD